MIHDRYDAGDQLAAALESRAGDASLLVVGIPRGGAMVAARAASQLCAEYECVPVCRIGMPCFPDLTLGALDPDGVATFDPQSEVTRHEIGKVGGALARRLKEQVERCRDGRAPIDLRGRDVIVVDQALDNLIVPRAIAAYLHRRGARRVSYAVPVAASGLLAKVDPLFHDVLALQSASSTNVLGWYGDAEPTDEEIRACLVSAWQHGPDVRGAA